MHLPVGDRVRRNVTLGGFLRSLAMALVSVACGLSTEPSDEIIVRVSVRPPAIAVGDTTEITMVASNAGERPFRFEASCPLSFEVYADSTLLEISHPWFCIPEAFPITIEPHDSIWFAVWVQPLVYRDSAWVPLQPGTYSVYGTLFTSDGTLRGEPVDLVIR